MFSNMKDLATFGVAGNFTGHLEQAGEDKDFLNVKTAEAIAPKAIFPTYIPGGKSAPDYLKTFPFSSDVISYPEGQTKLQIEPECAILFDATWEDGKLTNLSPVLFGASNDCSIRREGAKKISIKKNWGESSKGFSANAIPLNSFTADSVINNYRIASFLLRDGIAYAYGEDSAVRDYSYVYEKLTMWMLDKFNNQKDEGPAENIHDYLVDSGCPKRILVSIGATRYTEFGETNFLSAGDRAVVVLYPEDKYKKEDIQSMVEKNVFEDDSVSVLNQLIT